MRKLLAFLFLAALAIAVWLGGRWLAHRGEVKVTVVFTRPTGLHRGEAVVENGAAIGRVVAVDSMDDKEAVTVRLDKDHRRSVVTDSLFAPDHGTLVVTNTFAVGQPADDGAVLYAREDRVSGWLARHGGAVKPYLDKLRARADELVDGNFEEWTAKVPDWKREGSDAFERHIAEARGQVDRTVDDLKRSNKEEEARKLKERFERWLKKVRQ